MSKVTKTAKRQGSQEDIALVAALTACAKQKDLYRGNRLHAVIVNRGLLQKNIFISNTLINMYAKCGALAKAQEVFNELRVRDVVSWNALIAGYAHHGSGEEALNCFERMQGEGLCPSAVTFLCILQACGSIGETEKGKRVHAEIPKKRLLGKHSVLGTALVDMYAKCGVLTSARKVIDKLRVQNVVSWTALMEGYAQHGHGEEALNIFEHMQCECLSPNTVTFACVLKACGSIGLAQKGKEIHAESARQGLLGKDSVLGSALVDMYAKCGALAMARQVFDELGVRNLVSWTSLIGGYCQHGYGEEALKCFERMQHEGLSPDAVTFTCILKACGSLGASEKGKQIHAEIARVGLLGKSSELGSALVDMYVKCGALAMAQEVFNELLVRDVVSWTALIAGYAQVGRHDIVLNSFNKMLVEGIQPNPVTFVVVLNACNYLGLVDEGQMYLDTMSRSYGITPTLEHYTCMVDLFGRSGSFDKAMTMIKKMPFSDHLRAWFALLGACRKWGNVKLGRLAFEHAVRLDEKSAVAYVWMSTIYAAAGMQEDANKIEAMRLQNEAWQKSRIHQIDDGYAFGP